MFLKTNWYSKRLWTFLSVWLIFLIPYSEVYSIRFSTGRAWRWILRKRCHLANDCWWYHQVSSDGIKKKWKTNSSSQIIYQESSLVKVIPLHDVSSWPPSTDTVNSTYSSSIWTDFLNVSLIRVQNSSYKIILISKYLYLYLASYSKD